MKNIFSVKLIMIIMLFLGTVSKAYSMNNEWFAAVANSAPLQKIVMGASEVAESLAHSIERKIQERNREAERKSRALKEELNDRSVSEARKLIIQQQLADVERANLKSADKWDDVGTAFTSGIAKMQDAAIDVVKSQLMERQELRKKALEAEADKSARIQIAIETTERYVNAMKDPQNLKRWALTLGATSLMIFGSWHGLKLSAEMIKHLYRNPNLAEETSLLSMKEKFLRLIYEDVESKSSVSDVILESELASRVLDLTDSIKNTVKNDAYFRNILFYGPPGTGKTMVSKRIARSSGLEYIYFSGSSIDQFSLEEALIKLTELFEFAKKSQKKLMIIIDEAELLFANRAKELSDKSRKLLNLLLTYTGTENKNYFVVALTNRPEDLDDAFISRCDEQIEIGIPNFENRAAILKKYIKELLIDFKAKSDQPLWRSILGDKSEKNRLTVLEDAISGIFIENIAIKLDGFVGRDINKLVIAIQAAALISKDGLVTQDLINKIVNQKLEQKNFRK